MSHLRARRDAGHHPDLTTMEAALRQAATDHHATLTAQDVAVARASEAAADVLGMTDKRTLVFDERATRDADDSIVFWGNDGDTRVRFRISREALGDHFSKSDRLRPDAAFKKHRREIEGLARRKYLLGRKEPDGTVLIKTLDIAG